MESEISSLSLDELCPALLSCFPALGSGICREGENLVVGPTDDGKFLHLKVCSIQRNRSACRVLRAGQAATLALGPFDRSLLRKVSPAAAKTGDLPGDPPLVGWE